MYRFSLKIVWISTNVKLKSSKFTGMLDNFLILNSMN